MLFASKELGWGHQLFASNDLCGVNLFVSSELECGYHLFASNELGGIQLVSEQ